MNLDSKEELYYSWYLQELEDTGYINSFSQAATYQLGNTIVNDYIEHMKTKSKPKTQTILNPCEYTPDFEIVWNEKALGIFIAPKLIDITKHSSNTRINVNHFDKIDTSLMLQSSDTCMIEVKPNFDQNNMTRLNGINRKWMFDKHQIFVNLIKVPDIFKDTFTPQKYIKTDGGGQNRLIKFEVKSLEEYVQSKNRPS